MACPEENEIREIDRRVWLGSVLSEDLFHDIKNKINVGVEARKHGLIDYQTSDVTTCNCDGTGEKPPNQARHMVTRG